MSMRRMLLLPALLSMLSPLGAQAEVLAVCGKAPDYANLAILAPALDSSETVLPPLALWRDALGFDLLLNWGEPNQRSLRAEGADIIGSELGTELIHIVVISARTHRLEHFLFNFDEDAAGELIWNVPGESSGESRDVLAKEAACFKPK